jgi:hypothetical protein
MPRSNSNGWCIATVDDCASIWIPKPDVWPTTDYNSWLTLELADRIASTHIIHRQSAIARTRHCLQLNLLSCLCSDNSTFSRSDPSTKYTKDQPERDDEGRHGESEEDNQC